MPPATGPIEALTTGSNLLVEVLSPETGLHEASLKAARSEQLRHGFPDFRRAQADVDTAAAHGLDLFFRRTFTP